MKPTEFWHWMLDSERPGGKRTRSSWRMTAATALRDYADRNPEKTGEPEVCNLPETDAELAAQHTSAWQR